MCPHNGRYFHFFKKKNDMMREDLFGWRVQTDVSPLSHCLNLPLYTRQLYAVLILTFQKKSMVLTDLLLQPVILLPLCQWLANSCLFQIFWVSFSVVLYAVMSPTAVRNGHEYFFFVFLFCFKLKKGGLVFILSYYQMQSGTCQNACKHEMTKTGLNC